MSDALQKESSAILSFGGHRSNYCRVVAVAARQCGLEPHLVLQAREGKPKVGYECNHLLWKLCDARIHLAADVFDCDELVKSICDEVLERTKKACYVSPLGANTTMAIFGDFELWQELLNSGILERIDDIIVASATGITATGLAIANYLCGSRVRVHGIPIIDQGVLPPKVHFHTVAQRMLNDLGLVDVKATDIVNFIHGYHGKGFMIKSGENLEFNRIVAAESGIFLDGTFGGKGLEGFFKEFDKNPYRFKGNRVLFIHSGGLFNVFESDEMEDTQ